jgi:hypothetical protein
MPIWEFEKGHKFENWDTNLRILKKDIDLRYRCLWRINRTWIWGLDVDLRLNSILLISTLWLLCNILRTWYLPIVKSKFW